MKKNILSFLICGSITLGCAVFANAFDDIEEVTNLSGTFGCRELEDGTLKIVSFQISEKFPNSIEIPTEVNGKLITEIDPYAIEAMQDYTYSDELMNYYVEEGNQYFAQIDGILYDKKEKMLLACPDISETVEIPEGILKIGPHAFSGVDCETMIIPATMQEISEEAFVSNNIEEIVVNEGNECFEVYDGALYDINSKMLLAYPCDYDNQDPVDVKEGTIRIGNSAFYSFNGTKVTLPATLKSIGKDSFFCADIRDLVCPEGLEEIEETAFMGSKLYSIQIPASVKEIGRDILGLCDELERVKVYRDSYAAEYCIEQDYPIEYLVSKSSTEWLGTDELLETETEVAEADTVEELAKRIADSIFEDYGVLSINDCYFSNGGYILNVEVTNDYPYRVNGILKVHFNKDGKQVHTLPIVLPSGGIAAGKTMTIQGLNSYHEDFDSYSFDTSSIREM